MPAIIPQRMAGCDKYKLNTLDLMQSITITVPQDKSVRKAQQTIAATCRKPSLRNAGKRFTTRTHGNAVSVWRVE